MDSISTSIPEFGGVVALFSDANAWTVASRAVGFVIRGVSVLLQAMANRIKKTETAPMRFI